MLLVSIALVIAHLIPFAAAILLWRARPKGRVEWGLSAAFVWASCALFFFVGHWGAVGYYLRYLSVVFVLAATWLSWRRARRQAWLARNNFATWFGVLVTAAVTAALGVLAINAWRGRFVGRPSVALSFPLEPGTYYIGQGGSNRIVNIHRPIRSQQYALDITGLNRWGMNAAGIVPRNLAQHAIFGTMVVSPCAGEVVEAADGLPDLIPPDMDRKNTKGNYILLRCHELDVDVLLAHLQRGSVKMQAGDRAERRQELARVGNSGNTSQPHLHLQATREGEGIPMTFDGRFLARNALFRVLRFP